MQWQVDFSQKARKQVEKLPVNLVDRVSALVNEMSIQGPLVHTWKNFGKLRGSGERYHCHIKSGQPTYVVCWEVVNKKIRIIEVYYVGTHEKAPY